MEPKPPTSSRSTSLPLIALTLVAGIALGWLLHDALGGSSPQQPAVLPTAVAPTAIVASTSVTPTEAPPTAAAQEPTDPPAPTVDPPTRTPAPTATRTALPSSPTAEPAAAIAGYAGHAVAEGETLESIAARGGSTAALIADYNRLDGEPPLGRPLVVPQLVGRASELESEPLLVQRGRDENPWVALTLDAGASAEPVPGILKTLREHNAKITFFLTGAWIKDNPELTREIVADGHEIANHSFTHPDMRNLSDAAIRKELADTEALLQETAGATSRPFFRPPFGAYDERVLRLVEGEGYLPIYWTLDSLDSVGEPKTPAFLLERVTAKLTREQLRGAIILAHCGSQPTAEALPQILDRFAEMGFEVRTVSDVLGR